MLWGLPPAERAHQREGISQSASRRKDDMQRDPMKEIDPNQVQSTRQLAQIVRDHAAEGVRWPGGPTLTPDDCAKALPLLELAEAAEKRKHQRVSQAGVAARTKKGQARPRKLTPEQEKLLRDMRAQGWTLARLCEAFKVSKSLVIRTLARGSSTPAKSS